MDTNTNCWNIFLGKSTRYAVGCVIAFLSGLFFTTNNFIINATNVSFGELIGARSIIQIFLMFGILIGRGNWNSKKIKLLRNIETITLHF